MKPPFTIYDLRFTIGKQSDPTASLLTGHDAHGVARPASPDAGTASNPKSSIISRKSERGIALIITLIMLAVTLVMAVAFLALARRERGSVTTTTDTTTARLAADSAVAAPQSQIVANILANLTNGFSSSAYNLHLFVSTNYINSLGFATGSSNPTNVNYDYLLDGQPLSAANLEQNIANLYYLPRVPVFVPTNQSYDFRYYLDLNENGRFEPSGIVPNVVNDAGVLLTNPAMPFIQEVGDPQWIGVLEHPDAPHGPNNRFIARYAFIAVPEGNALDINYIHNQALNNSVGAGVVTPTMPDDYFRNQGVGSWEINLAAFLADLNTNIWSPTALPDNLYYAYREPDGFNNSGIAFDDARALLAYRYHFNSLPSANNVLFNAAFTFPYDGIDNYSRGPLQTSLDYNRSLSNPVVNTTIPWSGADNTNHYFTPGDFFDITKVTGGAAGGFTNRLRAAGSLLDTYDRYTYYRMLDQLGSDSSPDDGKINLNYCNINTNFINRINGVVTNSVGIIPNAETNLVPWRPLDFFTAAADKMLRLYTTNWFQSNPTNFLITYYGRIPLGHVDASGLGVTNVQYSVGQTNQIPAFGVGNIPVYVNGSFVYTPAVNRLLQLAANFYDATTNGPIVNGVPANLPHVFRPTFWVTNEFFNGVAYKNVYINGYEDVSAYSQNHTLTIGAPPLDQPVNPLALPYGEVSGLNVNQRNVNVYGVPWIIGAKKGLPNFNQFYMVSAAQVTRKLQIRRTTTDPATARYLTNQMYIVGISNSLGVSFWNSYSSNYVAHTPGGLTVFASDLVYMSLTNGADSWLGWTNFAYATSFNTWPGSQWAGVVPNASPNANSFYNVNWSFNFLNPSVYRFGSDTWDPVGSPTSSTFQLSTPPLPQLPQFGVTYTNYLQAFILDGNNVIDYVQLRDPISIGNLNQPLADPIYPDETSTYYQWSTNFYDNTPPTPYGVMNQLWVSGHPASAPAMGGQWSTTPTPMGLTTPPAEAAYFNGFFEPNFQYGGQTYINDLRIIQAPYTPSRTVYTSYLLQANDPLVHYLGSDLNSQAGALAVWGDKTAQRQNGVWYHSDDPLNQPMPAAPTTPIGGRYQPWGQNKQMMPLTGVDTNGYNVAYKDPLVWGSDDWDFPTNLYPSVGWIGRVHRGTPWQTVYLKAPDLAREFTASGKNLLLIGTNTWANWTGDALPEPFLASTYNPVYYAQYFDAANSAPVQDRLLFDIFTARINDNAARGSLPVNVGAGQPDGGLAAWSALFSGMVALTNNALLAVPTMRLTYTNMIINPAGVVNPLLAYSNQPPLWQIVNGPFGINATRTNTSFFPFQSFAHAGDILATPALSTYSPFLNSGSLVTYGRQQWEYGINDELYEWLPQHMMGLVRASEPRYVLYGYGQALRPAPGGTVLNGPFFQLVTNYQVVAESAVRAVIRVDEHVTPTGTNFSTVVESYNVLPPN